MITPDPKPYHIYPCNAEQSDLAHAPEARLVRNRPEEDCPLCQVGRCWQVVSWSDGVLLVTHGTLVA